MRWVCSCFHTARWSKLILFSSPGESEFTECSCFILFSSLFTALHYGYVIKDKLTTSSTIINVLQTKRATPPSTCLTQTQKSISNMWAKIWQGRSSVMFYTSVKEFCKHCAFFILEKQLNWYFLCKTTDQSILAAQHAVMKLYNCTISCHDWLTTLQEGPGFNQLSFTLFGWERSN